MQKSHLQILYRALASDNGLHEEACMHDHYVMMYEVPFLGMRQRTLSCEDRQQPLCLQMFKGVHTKSTELRQAAVLDLLHLQTE